VETFAREIILMRHKMLLAKLAEAFKPLGFSKKGAGVWRWSSDQGSFAGVSLRPRINRASKRLEFRAETLGGFAELHKLCWPTHRTWQPFGLGADFAQLEHDLVDPKGAGFVAKIWTLWPSTDIDEFWPRFHPRIVAESLPAIEAMNNRSELIAELERSIRGGPIYIRATNYLLSQEMIRILRCNGAYS
jgi:hypothetical protein